MDLYTFCTSWNKKEFSTKRLIKFTTSPCLSTLPGKTKTMYNQHNLKSIITVRSIEPVVGKYFRRKSSNVRIFQFLDESSFTSLVAEKLSNSLFL